MPRLIAIAAVLVALGGLAGRAAAGPTEELEAARTAFRGGAYADVIAAMSALLYPTSRLAEASALAEAHLLLGVAYFETGRLESAGKEIDAALFLDAGLTIEAGLFSEPAVTFFDGRKRELARQARRERERTRKARERAAINKFLASAVVVEKRSYLLNFMPFGAGQFQNGHKRKGIAFAASEGLLAGGSIGLLSYQVLRYGLSGKVPRDEVDAVRRIQVLQIGFGTAFYGVWIWGVIDALIHYEPAVRRELDPATEDELEKLYREDERPESAWRVAPMVSPAAAGAALTWEF